jgi:hypothetical protein
VAHQFQEIALTVLMANVFSSNISSYPSPANLRQTLPRLKTVQSVAHCEHYWLLQGSGLHSFVPRHSLIKDHSVQVAPFANGFHLHLSIPSRIHDSCQ